MTAEKMIVNLNKMRLNSISAFFSVNGKFSSNEKDCYFLRYIGCESEKDYTEVLPACESRFLSGCAMGKAGYHRTDRLPFAASPDAVSSYHQILGKLESLGTGMDSLGLAFSFDSPYLNKNLLLVFCRVLDLFRQISPHSSDSIVKNFAIKLLFWIDVYFPKLFPPGFTLSVSPKFTFCGSIKLQEYLFLYLLTQAGCDALYLNGVQDCILPPPALALSQVCTAAKQGEFDLPAFLEQRREAPSQPPKPVKVQTASIPQKPPAAQAAPSQRPAPQEELAYEQLALKAASVVMIETADSKGKIFKSGSGVMIGREGYILTNFHVISGGAFFIVRIETEDREYRTSQIIKYNNLLDLAVLQIDRLCTPIALCRNGKLTRGQKVVAIGSPLGLFNTVSDGIISAFRTVQDVSMIQFTAPISSGSSGGAVLNMGGELIGLSTAGFDQGQNLNLAVDYPTIRSFIGGLIR